MIIRLSSFPESDRKHDPLPDIGYDLDNPDRIYYLPHELREISGITAIKGSLIACVQDELGSIILYDLDRNMITGRIHFGPAGDYEDITRVGDMYYVVRSNELLTRVIPAGKGEPKTETWMTGIPGHDIEGLCYDRKANRLLIVPKQMADVGKDRKDLRHVYGFDLASGKLVKGPVIDFNVKEIGKFCTAHDVKVPMKENKKGGKGIPDIKFRISALGISHEAGRLFLISGTENLFFVSDMDGNIQYVAGLKKEIFPQAEGMTFLENGDMLISNEGRNGQGSIVRYNYRQSK